MDYKSLWDWAPKSDASFIGSETGEPFRKLAHKRQRQERINFWVPTSLSIIAILIAVVSLCLQVIPGVHQKQEKVMPVKSSSLSSSDSNINKK